MSGIGDLVVHLGVNYVAFRQGFANAQGIAARGSKNIEKSITPISGTARAMSGAILPLKGALGGLMTVAGPLAGALAAAFGASSAVAAAKKQRQAAQKLEAVLQATGGAAGLTAKQIGEYAGELQKATNFGDEVAIGAAAILATFSNIRGDNFKRALALTQDMATVMGTDLNHAAKKLGRSLKNVDPSEIGEKLSELEHRFGGAAAAAADPWTQLKNIIGDMSEQIGGILLPWVDMLSTSLMDVASQGVGLFGSLNSASQEWADAGMIAFKTLGDAAYLWYLRAELAVVQIGAALDHFFTKQVPAFFNWFTKNWRDIFFTAGDYALTVLTNLGENIRNLWKAVLDFIAGRPVKLDWKPLTEGAINAIKQMPDIPARIESEFEKRLKDDIRAQEEFLAKAQMNLAEELIQKRAEKNQKKAPQPFLPGDRMAGKAGSRADATVAALQKGSAEALSAIFKAMSSDTEDIGVKQLKVEEEQADMLDEAVAIWRDMRSNGLAVFGGTIPA